MHICLEEIYYYLCCVFSARTVLVGQQYGHLACKSTVESAECDRVLVLFSVRLLKRQCLISLVSRDRNDTKVCSAGIPSWFGGTRKNAV